MPRRYLPEFHRTALDLLKAGRGVAQVAVDLQIRDQAIDNWCDKTSSTPAGSRADVDHHTELVAARRRIAELETELAAHGRANELLEETVPLKGPVRRREERAHREEGETPRD